MMKRAPRLTLALLLLALAGPAWARDTYPRSKTLDALHYLIRLEIKEGSEEIAAETEVLFAATADGVGEAALDFGDLEVDAVTVDGRAARFTHAAARLRVTLPETRARGERFRVAVRYHGRPTDGLFLRKNKYGDFSVFADNWPDRAHHWFPSIDHPSDKATVEFLVTAPARFDVVANGALLETTSLQDGRRLTRWAEGVPVPVYCMVFGATDFSVIRAGAWGAVPVSFYLFPKDRDAGLRDYGRAVRMVGFYSELVGPYPYEKLALVQSSTRFGGMENASTIFFDEKAFDGDGSLEGTVAHEIAHQWFGDSVTASDWHHIWLSEGFATYFGAVFFERADGRERFLARMREAKDVYLEAYREDPRPVYDPSITDLFKLLNRNNYQKGAWVLHMLRRQVGDEKFFEGVRDYYRTYRDRNALTEDFQRVMESRAGRRLDWFFRQWIYEPGYPILDAAWRWDEPSKELRLRLTQKQPQTVFRLPLDLEVRTGDGSRREVVELERREQSFTFKLDRRPDGVAVDPDEWVLKVLSVREE